MKTSVNIPNELANRMHKYNRLHPDQPISLSGVARQALENKLSEVEE